MSGTRFALDGREFISNSKGLAVTSVKQGGIYTLEVLSPSVKMQRRELTFSLWSDGLRQRARNIAVRSFTFIKVGFNEKQLHFLSVVDGHGTTPESQSVDSVTFASAHGVTRMSYPPLRNLFRPVAKATPIPSLG